MKYLLLFAILVLVYLLWRHERRGERQERAADTPPRTGAAPVLPQEMVQCRVCALHLPRGDALVDARGHVYCCAEHRQRDAG